MGDLRRRARGKRVKRLCPNDKERILAELSLGWSIDAARGCCGISKLQLKLAREEDPVFNDSICAFTSPVRLDRGIKQSYYRSTTIRKGANSLMKEGNMKKLYVSNLSFNANENDVASVFEQYGTVTEVKVIYDRETNRSRGFGFVTYENAEEADAAITALNETDFMGRNIRVAEAQEKPRGNGGGNFRGNGNTRYNSTRY